MNRKHCAWALEGSPAGGIVTAEHLVVYCGGVQPPGGHVSSFFIRHCLSRKPIGDQYLEHRIPHRPRGDHPPCMPRFAALEQIRNANGFARKPNRNPDTGKRAVCSQVVNTTNNPLPTPQVYFREP